MADVFDKYKYMIDLLLKGEALHANDSKLAIKEINEKSAFAYLKNMKNVGILTNTGKLNRSNINLDYYSPLKQLSPLLAALLSRMKSSDKTIQESIQFLFTRIPQNIFQVCAKQYVRYLGSESLFDNLHNKRYRYFQNFLSDEANKNRILKIYWYDVSRQPKELIVLETFFFMGQLHICFWNEIQQQCEIHIANSISSSKILEQFLDPNIDQERIDKEIDMFILKSSSLQGSITVRLSTDLLQTIKALHFIDDFEIEEFFDNEDTSYQHIFNRDMPAVKSHTKRKLIPNDKTITVFKEEDTTKIQVKLYGNKFSLLFFIKLYYEQIDLINYDEMKEILNLMLHKSKIY